MRAKTARNPDADIEALLRSIERLDGLPIRPASARLGSSPPPGDDPGPIATATARPTSPTLADPGWAVERSRAGVGRLDPLEVVADRGWWPGLPAGATPDALARLWRHAAAVSIAARRLAIEADDPDPDAVARAGLLHNLGLWAVAAVDPARLPAWFAARDGAARRALERRWLGVEAADLGHHLARRWGCEPLVADAAWLHSDPAGDLNPGTEQPGRLALVQEAYDRARRTPWAPGDDLPRDPGGTDARTRILIAEVQARCGGAWVEADATAREERLTRDNARLRLDNARLLAGEAARDRFLTTFAASSPTDSAELWADRASLAWCEEPGVAAARVNWSGEVGDDAEAVRPPTSILALGDPERPSAEVRLWRVDEGDDAPNSTRLPHGLGGATGWSPNPCASAVSHGLGDQPVAPAPRSREKTSPDASHPARSAWDAWAREVEERSRLRRRLDLTSTALRARVASEAEARRLALVEALAEFAAGAGHELNNPLAVILGRAQLVLARVEDADARRSLQAIITQAQRAHRILRDLMYVARPPEPRARLCQPDEIVLACVRDLQGEAEARGVRLTAEAREPAPRAWSDPDSLRHLADILVRNALEATPGGGSVAFLAGGEASTLRWTVRDNGRGIGPDEAARMFDPFFCGRQAGRGLGLGLPRAARIVERGGGELRWQSAPGVGTTFQVIYPIQETAPIAPELPVVATRVRVASPAV